MGRRPVVALALVLFAGACGDDDEVTGTTDTTVAEAPGQGEPVTVEIDAAGTPPCHPRPSAVKELDEKVPSMLPR